MSPAHSPLRPRGALGYRKLAVRLLLEHGHGFKISPCFALIPRCVECEAVWLSIDDKRWQAWLTDDEPAEVVFYCPECAEREFGRD